MSIRHFLFSIFLLISMGASASQNCLQRTGSDGNGAMMFKFLDTKKDNLVFVETKNNRVSVIDENKRCLFDKIFEEYKNRNLIAEQCSIGYKNCIMIGDNRAYNDFNKKDQKDYNALYGTYSKVTDGDSHETLFFLRSNNGVIQVFKGSKIPKQDSTN